MADKIVECFEVELSKILGKKNTEIMINSILNDLNKTRANVELKDIPLIWKAIESSLVSLIGLSGIKILQELIYKKFEKENIYDIHKIWGLEIALENFQGHRT